MEAEIVPASILETAHRQNGRRFFMTAFTSDQVDMIATLQKMLELCGWNLADEGVWESLVLEHPRHFVDEVVMVARCYFEANVLNYELRAVKISSMGFEAIGPRGDVSVLQVFSLPVVVVDGLHKLTTVASFDELVESEGEWLIIAFQRSSVPASPKVLFLLFMRLSVFAPAPMRWMPRSNFCSRRLSHIYYWCLYFCFLVYVSKQQ